MHPQLQNLRQMIEFSIMAGNDITKPFMNQLSRLLEGSRSIPNVTRWVQTYGFVENHPKYKQIQCPSLQAAVERSRAFYTLAAVELDEPSNPIAALLGRGMTLGTFHSSLLAMHNGVYWETVHIEQPSLCGKTAETALAELRKRIYRMVLPEDVNTVTEFGISPTNQHFTGIQVDVDQYRSVPSMLNICPGEVQENLQHFERIITHQEVASTKSWFEDYGRRTGFLCHILRYFLLLNWKQNLFITQDEFCALFAVVFGSRNERWHQGLRIKPSPRSATISAWFQNVYLHAHRLLGGVLYLSDEFPTPADIFSGAVWNSYYAYRKSEDMPTPAFSRCKNEIDQTVSSMENRDMMKEIVNGVFG
ncbi:uncharacterized protein LOC124144958 isoform X2 [Haliotis rufescens]|uniref:uncharacterized protein LOC124144958 isoform X2 n=1 Tax=Haliotis rufescens TaxID=6454 RepID=UPI00201FA092|nr:uncharacterized protein LOC124144958 isoform X2 [Haliotis rufescens]